MDNSKEGSVVACLVSRNIYMLMNASLFIEIKYIEDSQCQCVNHVTCQFRTVNAFGL